jgi:hypothetical protein
MNKVALVSGAGSGLGEAMAKLLHEKGYTVYGTSRSSKSDLSGVHFLQMDFNDLSSIQRATDFISSKHGKLDLLINNAGAGVIGPLEYTDSLTVTNAFQANTFGPMELSRCCIPLLKKSPGARIVAISTIAGELGLPFRGIYSASKSALELYMESLSMELKSFGISVQIIQPGDFASDIASKRFQPNLPVNNEYPRYLPIIQQVNDEVNDAWTSDVMAARIIKQVLRSNPPLRKRVAPFMQRLSITLKHILPSRLFEKILMNHYKI